MTEPIYRNPFPIGTWEARLETLILVGRGEIEYPAAMYNEIAEIIGTERGKRNATLSKAKPKYDRADRNDHVNFIGVLGELIGQHIFYVKSIPIKSAPLLAENPVQGPDIIVKEYKFDTKCMATGSSDLMVNQEAHEKEAKGSTHYIHILPTNGKAQFWIHTYEEVNKWTIETKRFSPAYCRSIAQVLKHRMIPPV